MVTAFPVPTAPLQSLCPYSPPLTSCNLLGFFKLLLADYSCPYHASPLPRPVSYFLLSLLTFLISVLLPDPYGSISFPSNFSQCFHHSLPLPLVPADGGKESRTPGHPDLLPSSHLCTTAGVPPPASLQHPGQGWAQSRRILAQKPTTTLLQFPSPDSWCKLAPLKAAPGKPKSILFRQTDLPSIMKLPHSLICQQCWQCQEEQPLRWLSAGGVHSTPGHADGMQFIPHHKGINFPQRQQGRDSRSFHPSLSCLCQA